MSQSDQLHYQPQRRLRRHSTIIASAMAFFSSRVAEHTDNSITRSHTWLSQSQLPHTYALPPAPVTYPLLETQTSIVDEPKQEKNKQRNDQYTPTSFLLSEDPFAPDVFVPPLTVSPINQPTDSQTMKKGRKQGRDMRRPRTTESISVQVTPSLLSHGEQEKKKPCKVQDSNRRRPRTASSLFQYCSQQSGKDMLATIRNRTINEEHISSGTSSSSLGLMSSFNSGLKPRANLQQKFKSSSPLPVVLDEEEDKREIDINNNQTHNYQNSNQTKKRNHEQNGGRIIVRPQSALEGRYIASAINSNRTRPKSASSGLRVVIGSNAASNLTDTYIPSPITTPSSSISEDSSPFQRSFSQQGHGDEHHNAFVLDTNIPDTPFDPFGEGGINPLDLAGQHAKQPCDVISTPKSPSSSLRYPFRIPIIKSRIPPVRPLRVYRPRKMHSEGYPVRTSSFHYSFLDLSVSPPDSSTWLDSESTEAIGAYRRHVTVYSSSSSDLDSGEQTEVWEDKGTRAENTEGALERRKEEDRKLEVETTSSSSNAHNPIDDSSAIGFREEPAFNRTEFGKETMKRDRREGRESVGKKERMPWLKRMRTDSWVGPRDGANTSSVNSAIVKEERGKASRLVGSVMRKFKLIQLIR